MSAFKNFAITFLIAAVLFGIVGFAMTNYVSGIVSGILDGEKDELGNIINAPEDDEDKFQGTDDNLPEGDSFTFLVMGTDFRPDLYNDYYSNIYALEKLADGVKSDEDSVGLLRTKMRYVKATWFALVCASKENEQFAACYISPETKVSTTLGDITLGEVYGFYGVDTLCEYLTVMTGLDIDYKLLIDGSHMKDFVESMGSVSFELKSELYSAGEYTVSFEDPIETAADTTELPGKKTDKKKTDADETGTGAKDTDTTNSKETETASKPQNNPSVLEKGEQTLSDYSADIINTFREFSYADVDTKSSGILDMLKAYLTRCAEMSEQDLSHKIDELTGGTYGFSDVYSDKPVLATDFSSDDVKSVYSILGAVKSFEYKRMIYPGTFSEGEGKFIPDNNAAAEIFSKYRPDTQE
ncbi:MAG: hypothetical protein HFE30_01400 [Clostridiales bacterium]|nr:hypothetical protein [Clostridiales bacterium]